MSTTMTKSIRLASDEADALSQVASHARLSESALMKKWVLEGIERYKLEHALHAYMERDVDLRGGAALAGVSYNRFLHEVQKRRIVILEDDNYPERLAALADAFDSEALRQAVDQLAESATNGQS